MSSWFETFLTSGTVNRETVDVHNNLALVGEIDRAYAELDALDKAPGERSIGQRDPRDAIEARLVELAAQWDADKAVFTLAPVTEPEYQAIIKAYPTPPIPQRPDTAGLPAAEAKKLTVAYGAEAAEFRIESERIDVERNIAYVAASVEFIEAGGEQRGGVTPEQVRSLRNRPHGKAQFETLLAAALRVTRGEVEVSRPKSPENSTVSPLL